MDEVQTVTALVPAYAWVIIGVVGGLRIILMAIAVVLIGKSKMSVETWQETSLGIPKGSVRALLALFFCFVAIGVWINNKSYAGLADRHPGSSHRLLLRIQSNEVTTRCQTHSSGSLRGTKPLFFNILPLKKGEVLEKIICYNKREGETEDY